MAFWKKKSEDPWDVNPNRKREPVMFYERDPEPQPEPEPVPEEKEGLAMPVSITEQEEPEEAPECPWCGKEMLRAFIVGGRDSMRLSDEKPSAFLGLIGKDSLYFTDDGFWTNYKSCWQCKACRKLVADIPDEPTPNYVWENGEAKVPDSFTRWDGNPVAPYKPEKQENKE